MRTLKQQGVEFVSLSMLPGLRVDPKRSDDSRLLRRGLVFWREYLGCLFDMKGLYHFKSRFRPAYRNLYVAAYPRQTRASVASMIRCWGVLRLEPRCFFKAIVSQIKHRKSRSQMCSPSSAQERVFLPPALGRGLLTGEPTSSRQAASYRRAYRSAGSNRALAESTAVEL
jgi:phosphatidylglycerol lysyltransferase